MEGTGGGCGFAARGGFGWGPEGPGPYRGMGAVAPSDAGHCLTHPWKPVASEDMWGRGSFSQLSTLNAPLLQGGTHAVTWRQLGVERGEG